MGTRSTIAIERADGTVDQIYCHWDGYLEHNGTILFEHYSDPFKLQDLIDHGGISSLKKNIGLKHPFSPAYNERDPVVRARVDALFEEAEKNDWTTFYTRDRGEDLTIEKFPNFASYATTHQREEYAYILRNDGIWYVAEYDGVFGELAPALSKVTA
jgi:hypothetical protein